MSQQYAPVGISRVRHQLQHPTITLFEGRCTKHPNRLEKVTATVCFQLRCWPVDVVHCRQSYSFRERLLGRIERIVLLGLMLLRLIQSLLPVCEVELEVDTHKIGLEVDESLQPSDWLVKTDSLIANDTLCSGANWERRLAETISVHTKQDKT